MTTLVPLGKMASLGIKKWTAAHLKESTRRDGPICRAVTEAVRDK
jgi:hypothetical protein